MKNLLPTQDPKFIAAVKALTGGKPGKKMTDAERALKAIREARRRNR